MHAKLVFLTFLMFSAVLIQADDALLTKRCKHDPAKSLFVGVATGGSLVVGLKLIEHVCFYPLVKKQKGLAISLMALTYIFANVTALTFPFIKLWYQGRLRRKCACSEYIMTAGTGWLVVMLCYGGW